VCGVHAEQKGFKDPVTGERGWNHRADHAADPDADGNCRSCGLPTKVRTQRYGAPKLGHVFDHPVEFR
jgi:hypothetical protein